MNSEENHEKEKPSFFSELLDLQDALTPQQSEADVLKKAQNFCILFF